MEHATYDAIIKAVEKEVLKEPFSAKEVVEACPSIHPNTPSTFLPKHSVDNPGGNSVLFVRMSRGRYKLARPYKYGRPLNKD